ncbi:S41 family peptidase [Neisseria sp. Ec49-e6-T10]|uniref:S41 family peptidase n=1 Tax=Neisseria sp. Ec49-e6-T10 TaxID=3140744 RepID=UPI003EBEA8D6
MKPSMLKKISVYCTGALTGVVLSVSVQSFANNEQNSLPVSELRTFAEVYGKIKSDYVEPVTDDKLIQNAVKGMTSGLDPHSAYLTPTEFSELKEGTSGEFGGLGIEIAPEDGYVKIIAPIEGTPAERAGVKSGDLIVKIDETQTRDISTNEAVKLMRGKPGTKVTLTLARKDVNKPIVVSITRAIIKTVSVRSKLIEPDYAYVRIAQFQERTQESMVDAIVKMAEENKKPLKGLVIDLRDDPGGLLNGAVGVSAAFLPQGALIVSTKGRRNDVQMRLTATASDYLIGRVKDPNSRLPAYIKDIPITILINSGSASASEIVSGALQDHKRAVVVGTQSFGKGSVQSISPLSSGGGIKLTTALYYTPNDRSIQAKGILPDVEVKDSNDRFEVREADLGGHLANPNGEEEVTTLKKKAEEASEPKDSSATSKDTKEDDKLSIEERIKNAREPNPSKDPQLAKALALIKAPDQWKQSLGLAAKAEKKVDEEKAKKADKTSTKK